MPDQQHRHRIPIGQQQPRVVRVRGQVEHQHRVVGFTGPQFLRQRHILRDQRFLPGERSRVFAACVVYGRIAHDNEAVAVKAAGIDLFTLLRPAVLLGGLTTAVTAALSHSVIPLTQRMLQDEVLKDPEEVLYNLLKKDRSYRSPGSPYVVYVKDVQHRRLIDVVFKKRKPAWNALSYTN